MPPLSSILVLPPALLALLCQATANPNPTALRKLSPDSGEKLFPEHLAFAPEDDLLQDHAFALDTYTPSNPIDEAENTNGSSRLYMRAFGSHYDETDESILRRAAEALAILERRSSCPGGMSSCADIGSPNKCCQEGTYCTDVPDTNVGQVACCQQGSDCGGGIGDCPSNAVSCPASLGGGCCIPGYICQGIGCVTSPSETATQTEVTTSTEDESETITTTQTTIIEGEPSTVVITLTVTRYPSVEPTTRTTTAFVTATETEAETETETETETATATATGEAPWRPTITSEITSAPETSGSEDTQTGCPTGFYGCLATHGGGCCRTDRDCETHSCPAPSSTTIVSDGVTVVVAVDDVPLTATSTCADGWFLCGNSGGPIAGCCPSGYDCGTASCFTVDASQTAVVQKEQPDNMAAPSTAGMRLTGLMAVGAAFVLLMT